MGPGRVPQFVQKNFEFAGDGAFPVVSIVRGAVGRVDVHLVPFVRRGEDDGVFPMGWNFVSAGPHAAKHALVAPVRVELGNAHQRGAEGMRDLFDQFGGMFRALEGQGLFPPDVPKIPFLGRSFGFPRETAGPEIHLAFVVFERTGHGRGPGVGQGELHLEPVPVGLLPIDQLEGLERLAIGGFPVLKIAFKGFRQILDSHGRGPGRLPAVRRSEPGNAKCPSGWPGYLPS